MFIREMHLLCSEEKCIFSFWYALLKQKLRGVKWQRGAYWHLVRQWIAKLTSETKRLNDMTAYPKGKLGTLNVLMFKKEIKVKRSI